MPLPTHYAIVRTGKRIHHEGWCKTPEHADRAFNYAILGTEVLIYTREARLEELAAQKRRPS
jgi:hypothetical protein